MEKRLLCVIFCACIFLFSHNLLASQPKTTFLQVIEKTITVNGKQSQVFDVVQPDGTFGYSGNKGELFDVTVLNKTHVPLVLHWHGIIAPNPQDGVPYVTQLPILPGKKDHYHFRLKQAGTFWLHSHYKLQEQKLMAAPLIIHDLKDKKEHEALMFIQDFSFTDPKLLYERLRKDTAKHMMPMDHKMNMKADVSDVSFDAYLVNHRTLQNPELVKVTPNETLRLRIINASASSNYTIDLGTLTGSLIAVDGSNIKPIQGSKFQIAIGNRLDIRIKIPKGKHAYPILALPEGTKQQTGLILAVENANIPQISEHTKQTNPLLNDLQELKTTALTPLKPKPVQQSFNFNLEGSMAPYEWSLNGQEWPYITPTMLKPNQRTEFVFNNKTDMSHPMHLHGHVFQITEINGKKIIGREGDTINVLPHAIVKVEFDTTNKGIWMLHCHILYHQMGGMMTTVNYIGYPNRFTEKERAQGESLGM